MKFIHSSISSSSFPGILQGERAGLACDRLKLMGMFNISSLDKEQLRLKLKKLIKFKGDTQ